MEITKAQLEKMYKTMTNKELAKKLGISEPTLTATLEKSGIRLKGRGKAERKKIKVIE